MRKKVTGYGFGFYSFSNSASILSYSARLSSIFPAIWIENNKISIAGIFNFYISSRSRMVDKKINYAFE
jgi:hypothetical protein